jgi:RNA polymerase sigma factor (sigma-70 family)
MEVSAIKISGGIALHGRSALLRLQSDERLVAFVRRGNLAAFEVLVNRYESRLLAFCRHLLGSREDAEDVLQEVLAAAFNAMTADDRPINVRPWLYRIARNRSLNNLRRMQAVATDSMDLHLSEHGASTADKVHEREEFRLLVGDIHELPETQKTALVLREMDAMSYEQIAEAMETTVPSVKSLLVRARVSLAEAAEARLLSCDEVRIELGEIAEGLRRRPTPLVRRHLRSCKRCTTFKAQLRHTNKALAAMLPLGPIALLKKFAFTHFGHSVSAGSSATSSAGAAGSTAAAGSTIMAGSGAGGFLTAGVGAVATKAAAGLAAAALVTAGAVEVEHSSHTRAQTSPLTAATGASNSPSVAQYAARMPLRPSRHAAASVAKATTKASTKKAQSTKPVLVAAVTPTKPAVKAVKPAPKPASTPTPGRTQTQSDPTVLSPPTTGAGTSGTGTGGGTTTTSPPVPSPTATTASPPPTTGPITPVPTPPPTAGNATNGTVTSPGNNGGGDGGAGAGSVPGR